MHAADRLVHPLHRRRGRAGVWRHLGPGLITGAADDDPSGIGTYSQPGAQFGLGMLWTVPISFPLAAAVEELAARLGLAHAEGLASLIKRFLTLSLFAYLGVLAVVKVDWPAVAPNLVVPHVSLSA